MINHTRVDAFDFLLCGQLTARWRNSNRKSAFWWETWMLTLKPPFYTNSSSFSGWNTCIIFTGYWLFCSIACNFIFFCATLVGSVTSRPTDSGSAVWAEFLQSPTVSLLYLSASRHWNSEFIRHHMAAHQSTFGLEQSFYDRKSFWSKLLKQMGWKKHRHYKHISK